MITFAPKSPGKPSIKSKLRRIKWSLLHAKTQLFRNQVAPHQGVPEQGLRPYQMYPHGGNLSPSFITSPNERYPKVIERSTPIASMGSCFAVEIKQYLESGGYNYIDTEGSWAGSADWGRVYTTKNMLQIFQYTFAEFLPEISFCHTAKGVFDPYREGRFYPTEEEAHQATLRHREQSRVALTSCEILVLTPGQNEAWVNKSDGSAWAHKPPTEAITSHGNDYFDNKQFSLKENIDNINGSLNFLWDNNPNAKVIFTLSPVPSNATFYDINVAERSLENKAILLLAIKDVVASNPEQTFYFPSFEIAMLSHNSNLLFDNRHVRPQIVNKIMTCFDKCFLADA